MSGHIVNDFKDLRKLIGQVTKDQPAKTQYQQQAEKMGYRPEAEAKPKDDKGDRGIARGLGKKHAGEDDIKKAYMKLGRAAQGSVEYQKKLIQKQLAKMGFKTYSKFAFDNLFKFESNQMIAKWLINEVQLESALSDMQNIVKTKGARKINGIMVDMFTASVITRAYDKVSDANKKKMEKANLQTLVKLAHKIMGMKEELNLDESKMGDLLIDIQQGATAKELAKDHDISLAAAKSFLSDYYSKRKPSKAPGLKESKPGGAGDIDKKQMAKVNKRILQVLRKKGIKVNWKDEVQKESKMGEIFLALQQGWTAKEIAAEWSELTLAAAQELIKDYKRNHGQYENINEGGFSRMAADIEDGMKADKIAKKYGIDMKTAKRFVDDYKKVSNAPRLRAAENDPMKEGKYLKYSDLLLRKGRLQGKGRDTKTLDKEIEKEMKKLGIWGKEDLPEENIQEGTWAVPDTKDKMKALNKLMMKPLVIKGDNDVKKASKTLGNIIGDDGVEDEWLKMASSYRKGSAAMDARDVIDKFLKDWGFTVKNHQITHYPVDILDEDDIQERGNLKKPKKGKLLKLDNEPSRSKQVKEAHDHAKQSPFKLKSQRYPRAIAINNDGFGKRHATVEDIIAACDSFGMILDKELQVEQIQKQLGKVGFISYKKSELEDVFEERETQRIILALESVSEEQEPIGYTKNEITEAYIMGEEIEFLKPDGLKTAGPVLKKSGNTYNVKDKFTGKSYTYKYIGETEVKTFKEVVNEGRFSKQLIKQAGGIAFDKRYYQGNMSGAIKAIEKLKKGLSDDPKVREMLKIANESVAEKNIDKWLPEGGDKEAYTKFFNKALKKFGVSSPDELEGDKKKEFFDYVDKNWKGDHEEVEQDVHKTYKMDGRRKNFREKMKKLGYIKGR